MLFEGEELCFLEVEELSCFGSESVNKCGRVEILEVEVVLEVRVLGSEEELRLCKLRLFWK